MKERAKGKENLDLGRRIVVFIGPEGSGKSLQGEKLAQESNKPYITTGGIVRDLRNNDPGPLGDKCRNSTYLDGETLLAILANRLKKDDVSDGFVIDGALRTLSETKNFQNMLNIAGRAMPLSVVYLDVPIWESYNRLISGPKAGKRGREDDTKEGLANRLSKFYLQLNQRLEVIKNEPTWELIKIDASVSEGEVYNRIVENL